jgi:ABC-2 type transport system ATP-binding protein
MIKTESLCRRFGDFTAVDNVSLEINKGEVFAFLGPNGAGKTTTIRMLTGLIAPTSGKCSIEGINVTENPTRIHGFVGVLPEVPGLYETLSARRNLEFYGRLFGVKDAELAERIRRLLGAFDLWERREQAVQTYSKGMKQKVAICRSLIHDPEYVFMDEPMSGLDPVAAKTVKDFILDLKKQGKTVVLSTHNLDDADRLSDRIAVIKRNLLAVDTADNLRTRLFKRTVVFHLAQADDLAYEAVKRMGFVNSIERVDNKLILELDDPEGNNPSVVELLVEKGYKVQFIGELRHSLEEVYMKLVAQ